MPQISHGHIQNYCLLSEMQIPGILYLGYLVPLGPPNPPSLLPHPPLSLLWKIPEVPLARSHLCQTDFWTKKPGRVRGEP